MANISMIVREQVERENALNKKEWEDNEIRKEFYSDLPEFVSDSIVQMLDEMSDEEFKQYWTRSGNDWVQYEISIVYDENPNRKLSDAILDWMKTLIEYDQMFLSKLHFPESKDSLFRIDNLGTISKEIIRKLQEKIGTEDYISCLLYKHGTRYNVNLTLTFPR